MPIEIGAKKQERLVVSPEVAIDFLKLPAARVLSTPQMILHMERTSRLLACQFLDQGHDTVGTKVNVSHLAAAPIGSTVFFTSEVIGVDGRRVTFAVEARTDEEVIGNGTHERSVINVAKFAERLREKIERRLPNQ